MKKRGLKNVLVSFLILTFLITNLNYIFGAEIETYESELEKIRKEQRENMKQLSGIERDLAEYNYEVVNMDIQMNDYNKQLIDLNEKIEECDKKITEYEDSLNNTSNSYNVAQEQYIENLRYIYENGMPSIIEMLVTSRGFSDFIRKLNVYETILEYYQNLSGSIKNQKEYIEYVKEQLENQKAQVEQYKSSVELATEKLNDTISQKKEKMEELEKSLSDVQGEIDALTKKKEEAKQKVEDEIQRIVQEASKNAENGTAATFTGGQFVWPVDGYTTITTRFNEIYNLVNPAGSAHTGCDIAGAGISGKPIKAIEAGTVTVATYGNYGYGNYVILDHGKCTNDNSNYISLYGHATTLAVSKGEHVEKGQVIAYVGTTGNSTGPHLHLEIRIDGKLTDPLVQYPAMDFYFPYG